MRRITMKEAASIGAPKSWFISADSDGRLRLWRRTKTNRYGKGKLIEEALPDKHLAKLVAFWQRPEQESGYVRVRGDPAAALARYVQALRTIYLLPHVPRDIADIAEAALVGRLPKKRTSSRCLTVPCKHDMRLKECRSCARAPH